MVVIGLSNFTFARQVFISKQLRDANMEIERLTLQTERERIARDLHDLLGYTLTVIAIKSDVANRLFSLQPEIAHREIAEVEITAREALREVRSVVTGYRSERIETQLGRAEKTLDSAGVHLSSNLNSTDLSPGANELFCFVLREAITNILRHAKATACKVELIQDRAITLTIEDNGIGKRGPDGNGIEGLRERLKLVNGVLSIETSSLGGTRVLAEVPSSFAKETRTMKVRSRV